MYCSVDRSYAAAACFSLGLTLAAAPASADLLGPTQPAPAGSSASLDLGNGNLLGVLDTVGNGPDTAYLVVDFDATGGQAYAYAYAFDAADGVVAFDLTEAVTANTDLDYDFTLFPNFGNAIFVDNFLLPSFGEAGNVDLFWQFFTGAPTPGTVDWTSPALGLSDTPLTDGLVLGFYNGFGTGVRPAVPVVPEPAIASLLSVVGVALLARHRSA